MKTNYEGNCQESRYEAHGGNIYCLDVSNSKRPGNKYFHHEPRIYLHNSEFV